MNVQNDIIINGQAEDDSNQGELGITFERCRVEPNCSVLWLTSKHS